MKTNTLRVPALTRCARLMASAAMLMAALTNSSAALRPSSITAGDGQVAATVVDTLTGMMWLSVNVTKGQTYAQAEQGVWADLGFRHASSQELLTLVSDAGVNLDSAYWIEGWPWPGSFWQPTDVRAVLRLVTLLGPTYWNNYPSGQDQYGQPSVFGVLSDRYDHLFQAPGHRFAELSASSSAATVSIPSGFLFDGQSDLAAIGHFLVQSPVPEPGPVTLVLAGAAGLALRVRLRRRPNLPRLHGRALFASVNRELLASLPFDPMARASAETGR